MQIPFMNIKRQNDPLRPEYEKAFSRVMDHGRFILGPEVRKFEENFAAAHGAKYCAGTSSGTTALHLALASAGVAAGDEVITAVNTFAATAESICHCGAVPVFVDMHPDTYTLDISKIESAVTPKTKAIIPVHLYGCPADMDPILDIARKHSLIVIEDAAQAHLATYKGHSIGSLASAAAAFSFFPGKNLGALGDGGAVTTNDSTLYETILKLRAHGSPRKYYHDLVGYNYRMDSFTGAVLDIKLAHLENWTEIRRKNAAQYRALLDGLPLKLPYVPDYAGHSFHLFVVQTDDRERLAVVLKEKGVETNVHYPLPLHLQKAFACLGYREGEFPVCESAAEKILSLPLCAHISGEEIAYVAKCLREVLG